MRLSDFDYALPEELVAQRPAAERAAARLLVHELARERTQHASVAELGRFLAPGDLLVRNDTRVLPARIAGRRASGGRVELLFLEPRGEPAGPWSALAQPARRLAPGEVVELERTGGDAPVEARLLERLPGPDGRPGPWLVALARRGQGASDTQRLLEACGSMPLPPYVARPRAGGAAEDPALARLDRERYQTVYARPEAAFAVAAPTAGLHFTPELFEALAARGIGHASLTLHVGAGTFAPVREEEVERHRMHSERYELPAATAERVEATRRAGGRVVCVGTTSVRVLESVAAANDGRLRAASGRTELFLRPGSRFHVTDALLTNFHLPRSTLLMLVCAFAGRERVLRLYAEAIERRYRFFSYGDAMLLLGPARASGGDG